MNKAKIIMPVKNDNGVRLEDLKEDDWFIDESGALCCKYQHGKMWFSIIGTLDYIPIAHQQATVTPVSVEIKVTYDE
jgi:hypothetical protein